VAAQLVAGGQLVQADPLDEVGLGVDDGDLGVVGAEVAGEVSGCGGSGVSGPENGDAVPHDLAPVCSRVI
jgi:hypothetical protein